MFCFVHIILGQDIPHGDVTSDADFSLYSSSSSALLSESKVSFESEKDLSSDESDVEGEHYML